jgi:hypothetical protein
MANVIIDDGNLKDIANAIREKSGSTDTYKPKDMPQAILDIVSGGSGVSYTSITYNDDDTVTLIGTDGTEHTMVCTYEGEKLASVTYDDKQIAIGYEGEDLKNVGNTVVDLNDAKTSGGASLDHTVTFMVDEEAYEIVSVKNGNSVNAPTTEPTKDGEVFIEWQKDGEFVEFPYTPEGTETISALFMFRSNTDYLYESFGIDKETYPYVVVGCYVDVDGKTPCEVWFSDSFGDVNGRVIVPTGLDGTIYQKTSAFKVDADVSNQTDICTKIVEANPTISQAKASSAPAYMSPSNTVYYTNFKDNKFSFVPEYLT